MSKYEVTSFSSVTGDTPEESINNMGKQQNGCFVKTVTGFILLLLAVAVAVGVGLIVHFAENKTLDCSWPDSVQEILSEKQQQNQGAKACPTPEPHECPTCPTAPGTTAAPTQTPILQDVRLPKTMIPKHYRMKIKPDLYGSDPSAFTFNGTVWIEMECKEPTDTVTLHINMLNVSGISFTSMTRAGNSPRYVSHHEDRDRQFLIVQLNQATQKGHKYTLQMDFVGPLLDDLQGLYLSSYKEGNQTKYLAATQFEPTDARKAFPCFDEPAMKATFQLTIVKRDPMKAVSNMPIDKTTDIGDGFQEVKFQTSEAMSTYLVAYVVGQFSKVESKTTNGLKYGAWARPSMIDQVTLALDVGIKTITAYENYFNISFPLPKQDMIALPDFRAGAMENWGLITYREKYMLFYPGVSSELQRNKLVSIIAHELAHQWFGDLVTMDWWDDIWLNEGFASFVEYLGQDAINPEWNIFEKFTVYDLHTAFDLDGLVTSHPIFVPLANPDEIHEVFDGISYQKGSSIIRMMRFVLGEETFRKGLIRYLNAHQYGNANHDDLWNAMSEQSQADNPTPVNVKEVMDTWTLQMNYPVVMVIYSEGRLKVTQKHFLQDTEAQDPGKYSSQFDYTWQIPFTVTSSLNPQFNVTNADIYWLSNGPIDMPYNSVPENGWVLGNVQQYGLYRVNYEASNWQALIRQLKIDHKVFSTINRAQLLNDAWSLSRAEELSTETALSMLEYLNEEMDYTPWYGARKQIKFLTQMLDMTDLYGPLQSFMQSKLSAPFKHYGMDDVNATHTQSLTRSIIVEQSCQFGIQTCVQQSQKLYRQWMDNPETNLIDPDLRSTVYCTAISEGGEEEWNFAFNQFQSTDVVAERDTLSNALACTQLPWLLSKYLELALDPNVVRKQDATYVIIAVSQNPIGRLLTWDFIRSRWDYLQNSYGKGLFSFAKLIGEITSSFNTQFQLEQLKYFREQHPNMGTANRAFQQAIEKTASNIKWMNNNMDTVSKWLTTLKVAQQQRVTDVRLPRHLEPISYDLTLKPNMYNGAPETFIFEGRVRIHMLAKETGRNVTLHTNKLTIDEKSIVFSQENGNGGPTYNGQREHDDERQFEIFYLSDDVVIGQNYYIEMNFTGPLKDDLAGLYLSSYKRNNNENDIVYLATTQFESTDARKAFPCFDEPDMKATFKVSLIRKKSLISISNMPQVRNITIDAEFEQDDYDTSAKMSTYLLAFIICDFTYKSNQTARGTKYRAFARPESINQVDVALKAGVDILSFYEDYFGIDFPLPKQDMIAIPDFSAGAMENWGLITYRETAMLYKEGVSSQGNLQRVNVVVAHELAHQWFGDLVTMEWWDDLWLNEGFASFVEYLGTDHQHPEWKMFDQFVFELYDVFDIDGLVTSHPIYVPVHNPDEINEIFDSISYGKGGSVVRMARFFLGENTFKLGVQRYLKARKFQNANHNDLWQGWQEQADSENKTIKVKDIMDTWILQMNYPVVTVTHGANGNIIITQERCLIDKDAKDPGKYVSEFGYKWKIPFTFTTEDVTDFEQTDANVTWLDESTKDLGVKYPDGWIVANIQQYGVYRVNYDEDNWNKLFEALKTTNHQKIHTLNRGQIINDAFGLARGKRLKMDTALKVLEYLTYEMDYIPWKAADTELQYLNHMLSETEIYGQYQKFVLEIVGSQYNRLGLNDTGSSHLESYLRSDIANLACYYGDKGCVKNAIDLYQKYMDNPTVNPIDPGLKSTVYCTSVREGGETEWQFAYDNYKTATVEAEKSRLLSAMCCTKEIWIINKVLAMSLKPDVIKKQDAYKVYVVFGRSLVGRTVTWNFLKANWDAVFEEYGTGAFSLDDIIEGVTRTFNSEYLLQEMKDFQKQHPDLGAGTQGFARALEHTQANIAWMNDNYNIVKDWLTTRTPSN